MEEHRSLVARCYGFVWLHLEHVHHSEERQPPRQKDPDVLAQHVGVVLVLSGVGHRRGARSVRFLHEVAASVRTAPAGAWPSAILDAEVVGVLANDELHGRLPSLMTELLAQELRPVPDLCRQLVVGPQLVHLCEHAQRFRLCHPLCILVEDCLRPLHCARRLVEVVWGRLADFPDSAEDVDSAHGHQCGPFALSVGLVLEIAPDVFCHLHGLLPFLSHDV
mmetsp:Transcript_109043/g.233051  ORF Transcript_109043/g.233051 Transcript_109043/m.233051 type:complete len:221 (-) Transcript_109043:1277-1939(-)